MNRSLFTFASVAFAAALLMPAGVAVAEPAAQATDITRAELIEARAAGYAIVTVPEDTDAATLAQLRKAWAAHGMPAKRVYFESSGPE